MAGTAGGGLRPVSGRAGMRCTGRRRVCPRCPGGHAALSFSGIARGAYPRRTWTNPGLGSRARSGRQHGKLRHSEGWPLMESAQIARRFLSYFEQRTHTVVPSASLIANDPTLLLINAGMAPFKPYFLGQQSPPFPRAASAQKCVRTEDIEEVGKTTRHATFFQMLGNFSFGDYFKDQAIPFAWELLTRPERDGGFGFPESKLWVTVYTDDDEAFRIWHDQIGVPEQRIQRRGMADNFWSMGVPGPCGPCSEIYYDRGPEYGGEPRTDSSLRVIADHVRCAVMLVADGVIPSNEGRGYVLRRILRRSIRNLRLLAGGQRGGARGEDRFIHELASVAITAMGEQYPELISDAAHIHTVVDAEEESFLGTLRTGTAIFEAAVEESKRRGAATLGGEQAFQLHDTDGFPIDLTLEMAAEQGLSVDEEGFRRLMTEQRERAKADAKAKKGAHRDAQAYREVADSIGRAVEFTGYTDVVSEGSVRGIVAIGGVVPSAREGDEVE